MNRRLALSISLGALLVGRIASAQEVTIGYQGLPYKATGENNTGIQIADGVLLHTGIGVEAGYDTNVFFAPNNEVGSSIFRVMPYLELTNATRTGPTSKELTFDAHAGLQYRHYGNSEVSSQYADAWNPNAGLSLSLGGAQFGFGVADVFARIEDPPYANPGDLNANGVPNGSPAIERTNNQASIEGRWAPGGGRLTTTLRFTNMVNIYDNNGVGNYSYANAISNTLMLDVAWKWLPKTAIFLDISQSYVDYLNNGAASANFLSNSYPLYVTAGLRGLLTEKTSAVLTLGYVNGFYSNGTSTGGFLGSTYLDLAFTVRLTQLSRAVVGYRHDFINAVISNFAYEETAYASYVQQIAGRLGLDLSGRYAYLSYQGATGDPTQMGRIDNFFQIGATLDYFLRNWAYLGVGYSVVDNHSNIASNDYLKQQVFARLGITY
jgi:Putative beta-barrel porin 2